MNIQYMDLDNDMILHYNFYDNYNGYDQRYSLVDNNYKYMKKYIQMILYKVVWEIVTFYHQYQQ